MLGQQRRQLCSGHLGPDGNQMFLVAPHFDHRCGAFGILAFGQFGNDGWETFHNSVNGRLDRLGLGGRCVLPVLDGLGITLDAGLHCGNSDVSQLGLL